MKFWFGLVGVGYEPKNNLFLYMKLKLEAFGGDAVIYCIGNTDMKSFLQAACQPSLVGSLRSE